MSTIASIIQKRLNDRFPDALRGAFAERFGKRIETSWSPLAGAYGGYVSSLESGKAFNEQQIAFIAGFEGAWLTASSIVGE